MLDHVEEAKAVVFQNAYQLARKGRRQECLDRSPAPLARVRIAPRQAGEGVRFGLDSKAAPEARARWSTKLSRSPARFRTIYRTPCAKPASLRRCRATFARRASISTKASPLRIAKARNLNVLKRSWHRGRLGQHHQWPEALQDLATARQGTPCGSVASSF